MASIKEKGILQPVLARKISGSNGTTVGKWEIIAGNRRLAAAKELGLDEIPAQIVEMNDGEAREAQIIENLQRVDIHPIDEGEHYRELVNQMKMVTTEAIGHIAARVGKARAHVLARLSLTGLNKKIKDDYYKGKLPDGHAVLIAKLSDDDQIKAYKAFNSRYHPMTFQELKEWIDVNIYTELENQPWVGDANAMTQVGPCKECKPDKMSLFGPVKDGACTDTKCWGRKMQAYVGWIAKAGTVKISTDYYDVPKGLLSKSNYVLIGKASRDRCESREPAIIAHGTGMGKRVMICSDKKCESHGAFHSGFALSPEEKEKRKNEKTLIDDRREKADANIRKAIDGLDWPSKETVDILFEAVLYARGMTVQQPVCKRLGLEPEKKESVRDYEQALRNYADTPKKKMQVTVELLMPGFDRYDEKSETLNNFLRKF